MPESCLNASWFPREAALLAQDPQSYLSTYQAAQNLVDEFCMFSSAHAWPTVLITVGITIEDVKNLTPEFWEFYLDG